MQGSQSSQPELSFLEQGWAGDQTWMLYIPHNIIRDHSEPARQSYTKKIRKIKKSESGHARIHYHMRLWARVLQTWNFT